ncbi:putative SP-containing protein [Vairimorpha necatrix]|uniref:SP-containing protein n=1 Tax=Vairimorpha necatrix TaxID=6039 RepID=A0AAX4J8A2_9MICR
MIWIPPIVFMLIAKSMAKPPIKGKIETDEDCKKQLSMYNYTFTKDYYETEKFKIITKVVFKALLDEIKFPLDEQYHYFSRDKDVKYKIIRHDLKYINYMYYIMYPAESSSDLDDDSQEYHVEFYKAQAIKDLVIGMAFFTKKLLHTLVCINYRDKEMYVNIIRYFFDKFVKIKQNEEEKILSFEKFNFDINNFFNDLNKNVNMGVPEDINTQEYDKLSAPIKNNIMLEDKGTTSSANESNKIHDNRNESVQVDNVTIQYNSGNDIEELFVDGRENSSNIEKENNAIIQSNMSISTELKTLKSHYNNSIHTQDNYVNLQENNANDVNENPIDDREIESTILPANENIYMQSNHINIIQDNNIISQINTSSFTPDNTTMLEELTLFMQDNSFITIHDSVSNLGFPTYNSPNYLSSVCILPILFHNTLGLN